MSDEFEEEEVWSYNVVRPMEKIRGKEYSTLFSPSGPSSSSSNSSSKKMRQIPRSSTAHVEEHGRQYSAPINIPDWSKIYGHNGDVNDRVADDGDDEEERVPPHEWLAMKLARSQISSFSVCEGEGRTLKGRDQCKVRNAVLTRTGFLE